VNLKNAHWLRQPDGSWRSHWVVGREGMAPWSQVAAELKARAYRGDICLCAEYSDEKATNRLIAEDLAYARSLFA